MVDTVYPKNNYKNRLRKQFLSLITRGSTGLLRNSIKTNDIQLLFKLINSKYPNNLKKLTKNQVEIKTLKKKTFFNECTHGLSRSLRRLHKRC